MVTRQSLLLRSFIIGGIMNKIIAIVGMCGSGKSVASDYLESIGYKKVYFFISYIF